MHYIRSFTFEDNELYKKALQIRSNVFVYEQQVPVELEVENEEQAKYYLIFEKENPVGTGRWRKTKQGIKLERFAILSAYRNKGIGSILLKYILNDLKDEGSIIYLHSQIRAVKYYQRHGFVIAGDIFVEAGIEHYKMVIS